MKPHCLLITIIAFIFLSPGLMAFEESRDTRDQLSRSSWLRERCSHPTWYVTPDGYSSFSNCQFPDGSYNDFLALKFNGKAPQFRFSRIEGSYYHSLFAILLSHNREHQQSRFLEISRAQAIAPPGVDVAPTFKFEGIPRYTTLSLVGRDTILSFVSTTQLVRPEGDFSLELDFRSPKNSAAPIKFTLETARWIRNIDSFRRIRIRGVSDVEQGAWEELCSISKIEQLELWDIGDNAATEGFQKFLASLHGKVQRLSFRDVNSLTNENVISASSLTLGSLEIVNAPAIDDELFNPSSEEQSGARRNHSFGGVTMLSIKGPIGVTAKMFRSLFSEPKHTCSTPLLSDLRLVQCDNCFYTSDVSKIRMGSSRLSTLKLVGMPGEWDAFIVQVLGLKSLKRLWVQGKNILTAAGQAAIGEMSHLQRLTVDFSGQSDAQVFIANLHRLASLYRLTIHGLREGTEMLVDLSAGLSAITNLRRVDLECAGADCEFASLRRSVMGLRKLTHIRLSGISICYTDFKELLETENLVQLRVGEVYMNADTGKAVYLTDFDLLFKSRLKILDFKLLRESEWVNEIQVRYPHIHMASHLN